MSYADKEKQRAYQREWSSKHKTPRKSSITWKELHEQTYCMNLTRFEDCVAEAKLLTKSRRTDRLAIAALAMRACQIRHGGDRRTENYAVTSSESPHLRQFAEQAGLNYKTLFEWVRTLRFIRMHVPEDAPIDFTAANLITRKAVTGSPEQTPVDLYTSLVEKGGDARKAYNAVRFLRSVVVIARNADVSTWPEQARYQFHTLVRQLHAMTFPEESNA